MPIKMRVDGPLESTPCNALNMSVNELLIDNRKLSSKILSRLIR